MQHGTDGRRKREGRGSKVWQRRQSWGQSSFPHSPLRTICSQSCQLHEGESSLYSRHAHCVGNNKLCWQHKLCDCTAQKWAQMHVNSPNISTLWQIPLRLYAKIFWTKILPKMFDWISGLCFIVIHVPMLGRRPISVWCCQIAHTLIGLTSQLNWLTTTMSPAQHNKHFGDLESWLISKKLPSHLFIAIRAYNLPNIIVWFEFVFSINRVYAAFSHWTLVHVSLISSDHGWPPSIRRSLG